MSTKGVAFHKRRRFREPKPILPDEIEAILEEIAAEPRESAEKRGKARPECALNAESGIPLALSGRALDSCSSAGPEAPSRSGTPGQ